MSWSNSMKCLHRLGFMPGTSNTISPFRLDDHRLLIRSRRCQQVPAEVGATWSSSIFAGRYRSMDIRRVTSEIGMHLAVYRQQANVKAGVVHSPPPIATAFRCVGRGLERDTVCQEAVMSVPRCSPIGKLYNGNQKIDGKSRSFHPKLRRYSYGQSWRSVTAAPCSKPSRR